MDLQDPSTQLMFTTVPVHAHNNDGDDEIGTAFFYSLETNKDDVTVPLLIVNAHTVEDAHTATVYLNSADNDGNPSGEAIPVRVQRDRLTAFHTRDLDLIAFPIGDVLNELAQRGQNPFFKTITQELIPDNDTLNDLSAIEDVTFIGYPSGLMDRENSMPIARRGVTATAVWNNYNGEPQFLIDAGVYPGSSGSPVFIFDRGHYTNAKGALVAGSRLIFLGLISQTMVHEEQFDRAYLGLGKVIRTDAVTEYINAVSEELLPIDQN